MKPLAPLLASDSAWPPAAEPLAESALASEDANDTLGPELSKGLSAPANELMATPVSTRVAIAAANEGRRFVHHELRMPPLLHADLLPELDVDLAPELWRDGVLRTPKYFSAFLDAPRPTFDPNHRAKWRPHELLHRLARFAWSPTMTRFEAYLSARISELLPVVHWYGFDEIGRVRCPAHYGVRPTTEHCPACDQLSRPATSQETQAPSHREHATRMAVHALDHLATELDACQQELGTGRIVATPRIGLDASSDAVGYMRSHWNRLTAWSFGAWAERFCVEGADHFADCAAHLEHVQGVARDLLVNSWGLDAAPQRAMATQLRTLQDVGYRSLLCIEALDSDEAEDALLPLIDQMAEHTTVLRRGSDVEIDETMAALADALETLDPAANAAVFGIGEVDPAAPTTVMVDRICSGLRSALPRSLADVGDEALAPWVSRFILSGFTGRAEVFVRFAAFLQETEDRSPSWADPLALEAWLRASPSVDLEAERFAAVPDGPPAEATGRLRPNATIRRRSFSSAAAMQVLDIEHDAPTVELLAAHFAGSPRAVACSPDVLAALEKAEDGLFAANWEAVDALLASGLLVWLPTPA